MALQPDDYPIRSYFILGAQPSIETSRELLALWAGAPDQIVSMQVFEVHALDRQYYVCWAGGKINHSVNIVEAGDVDLTLAGKGAIEALAALPGEWESIVLVELRKGPTPLLTKLLRALAQCPPGRRIAIVGDLRRDLDGELTPLFNIVGMKEIQDDGSISEALPGGFPLTKA